MQDGYVYGLFRCDKSYKTIIIHKCLNVHYVVFIITCFSAGLRRYIGLTFYGYIGWLTFDRILIWPNSL